MCWDETHCVRRVCQYSLAKSSYIKSTPLEYGLLRLQRTINNIRGVSTKKNLHQTSINPLKLDDGGGVMRFAWIPSDHILRLSQWLFQEFLWIWSEDNVVSQLRDNGVSTDDKILMFIFDWHCTVALLHKHQQILAEYLQYIRVAHYTGNGCPRDVYLMK